MVILVVERGWIWLKIVAIQTSNPFKSIQTSNINFFRNSRFPQKNKHNFNENTKRNFCWSHLLCFQYSNFEALNSFEGNPSFQVILNLIIQILLIIALTNTKISKTHSLLSKILLFLFALFSVYCDLCFLHRSQRQMFFISGKQCSAKFQTSKVIIRAVAWKTVFTITSI